MAIDRESKRRSNKLYRESERGKTRAKIHQARWLAKDGSREKLMEAVRRYHKTPNGRAKQAAAMKKWQEKNKAKQAGYMRKMKFGLTPEDTARMIGAQNGQCPICHDPCVSSGKFHVDHDHVSGHIRGLLCHCCNVGLGYFKDNIESLEASIVYLKDAKQAHINDQMPGEEW